MKKELTIIISILFLLVFVKLSIGALNLGFDVNLTKSSFYPNETIPLNITIKNRETTFSANNLKLELIVGKRTYDFDVGNLKAGESITKSLTLPEQPAGSYLIRAILNYSGYFGETTTVENYNNFEVKFPELKRLPRNIYISSFSLPENIEQDKSYEASIVVTNNDTTAGDLIILVEALGSNTMKEIRLEPNQIETVKMNITFLNAGLSTAEARVYGVVDDVKYLLNYLSKSIFVKEVKVAKLSIDRIELVDEPDNEMNQNDIVKLKVYLKNDGNSMASSVKAILTSSKPSIQIKKSDANYVLIVSKESIAPDYFEIETEKADVGDYNLNLEINFVDFLGSHKLNFLVPITVKKDSCNNDNQCASDEICSKNICSKLSCGYCEYSKNHLCLRYQCCSDNECKQNEFCDIDNSCKRKMCVDVKNSGNPVDKLDIVFVGDNYTEDKLDKFEADVNAHSEKILSVYPFSALKDKINIHRVDKFADLDCKIYGDRCVICDDTKVKEVASFCPNDKIIVLWNSDRWVGCAGLFGIAAASSKYSFISLHEFGHSFGGLWDEYSYGGNGISANGSPNCDDNGSCLKWSEVKGTGCFQGCTKDNFFRSIENGIMRTVSDKFGVVDENQLIKLLDKYK